MLAGGLKEPHDIAVAGASTGRGLAGGDPDADAATDGVGAPTGVRPPQFGLGARVEVGVGVGVGVGAESEPDEDTWNPWRERRVWSGILGTALARRRS